MRRKQNEFKSRCGHSADTCLQGGGADGAGSFAKLGVEVRKQWKQVQRTLPGIHPGRLDADIGYVLSPQWGVIKENGSIAVKVGVKVSSWNGNTRQFRTRGGA